MIDLSIVNGNVLTDTGITLQDIGVHDGKITVIAQPGQLPAAETSIDAGGKIVMAGAIDSHFHCRAPGEPEKEDFLSASSAAAHGGVTTLLEMPVSTPPAIDGESLTRRQTAAEQELVVDMGFYGSAGTLDHEKIQELAEAGAIAFKAFYQHVPEGREADLEGLCIPTLGDIRRAMQMVASTGRPFVIHAEEHWIYAGLVRELQASGRNDPQAHTLSRPAYVEAIAIQSLVLLAEALDVHLHIPHVSSAQSVAIIRESKRRGSRVTAETCPHYLTFTHDRLRELGPFALCYPPLKGDKDVDALWEGLADGTIDTVATDHSPTALSQKEGATENIWKAAPGLTGVDILVPFMMSAADEGKISQRRALEAITSAPADIFGLGQRKGQIAVNLDADITIYDADAPSAVDSGSWLTKSSHAGRIWDGYHLQGRVATTIVRGQLAWDEDRVVATPGTGGVVRVS